MELKIETPASPHAPSQAALALFDTLVELDSDECLKRLRAIALDDSSLAQAVEAMLRADAASTGVLDRGLEALIAGEVEQDATAKAPPLLQAGDFQLLRQLGHGGMGEVWLAERRSGAFVQQVAVKLLKRGMDSDALVARFTQERRILAELAHPGIARFVDGGVAADGRLFYAMGYIDGVALTDYAEQQALGARERVRLLIEVCDAVAYAQARLIVHRDLKPTNILVDPSGHPHVLDFGIAKLLGDKAPDDSMTRTGSYVLSASYAAPEQILGESISTATDVYSLGVILFELLTGQLPHARQGLAFAALADSVRDHKPKAPSEVLRRGDTTTLGLGTARILREINADLDTVVLTALQSDATRRYVTAAAFGNDLRCWLEARPIAARADSRSYRFRKFVVRNRYAVGSATGVFLALLLGLAAALWQATVARQHSVLANEQKRAAEEAYRQSELVNQFFASRISEAMATQQAAGSALTVKDWVLGSFPRLETLLANAPGGRARLRRELAASLRELGDLKVAAEQGRIALEESRAVYGDGRETAAAAFQLATTLVAMGEFEPADRLLDETLRLLDQVPADDMDRQNRINARAKALQIAQVRGDLTRAMALAQQNIVDRAALHGADSAELAVDYNVLSSLELRVGHLAEAERSLQRAAELQAKDPNEQPARIAFIDQGLCVLRLLQGDAAAAEELCRRAVAQYEKVVGINHPNALGMRSILTRALINRGDTARARAEIDAILPLLRAKPTPMLADALMQAARIAAAQRHWREVSTLAQLSLTRLSEQGISKGTEVERAQALRLLGEHAIRPSDLSLAKLRDHIEPLLARNQAGDLGLNKANLAWCLYQGLLLSGQEAAAQAIAARAVQLMQPNMSASAAAQQWKRWEQGEIEP